MNQSPLQAIQIQSLNTNNHDIHAGKTKNGQSSQTNQNEMLITFKC